MNRFRISNRSWKHKWPDCQQHIPTATGSGVTCGIWSRPWHGMAVWTFMLDLPGTSHRREQETGRGERDHVLSLLEEELANLGDDHPSFRFTY